MQPQTRTITERPFYQRDYRLRALLLSLAAHTVAAAWLAGLMQPPAQALPKTLEVTFFAPPSAGPVSIPERARPAPTASQTPRARTEPALSPATTGVAVAAPTPATLGGEERRPVAETTPAREAVSPDSAPLYAAEYLSNPAPPYPALARRLGEEGRVLLRVQVTADGRAAQVMVAESSGSRRLDRAAEETVWRYRFVPARRGGEAIDAWVRVPMVFKLEG